MEEINIQGCSVSEIEPGALRCLHKLKTLDLRSNKLHACFSIEQLSSLESLELSSNQIDSIDDLCSKLNSATHTKLVMLNLNENRLKELPANSFSSLQALRQLNLTNNKIGQIDDQAFTGLVNLRQLYLNHNPFKAISQGLFAPLPNLNHLGLFGTKVRTIEEGSFSHFRNQLEIIADDKLEMKLSSHLS